MTGWVFVPVWCLLWLLTYKPSKDIHTANLLALIVAPAVVWLSPDSGLSWCVAAESLVVFRVVALVLCILILIRHADVVPTVLKSFLK